MNISDKHLSTVLGSYAANPFLYKVHQRQMSVPMDSVIIRGRYRLNEAFQEGDYGSNEFVCGTQHIDGI